MPPPDPPKVKLGLTIKGKPAPEIPAEISFLTAFASEMVCATPDLAVFNPIFSIATLNFLLSSALSIASRLAPINSIFKRSNIPSSESASAKFSAVCPPIVGKIASGFSLSSIFSNINLFKGSM